MKIFCCACKSDVNARLTNGSETYPHRSDLSSIPFWKCDVCGNFVGCHYKTSKPTQPLGHIPTPEIKNARQHIHMILDPLWQNGKYKRSELYKIMSKEVGWKYQTEKIRNIEEARLIYRFIKTL